MGTYTKGAKELVKRPSTNPGKKLQIILFYGNIAQSMMFGSINFNVLL